MVFPYSYDQVVDAIASSSGRDAHYALTDYLHLNRNDVGAERFRRLLATAKLRGSDQMNVHMAIARLDPSYASELPGVLRSTKSVDAQQVLVGELPKLLPRGRQDSAVADEVEAWLRRRVRLPSYSQNYATWEIPSVVLVVLYGSNSSRTRTLLADLEPHLDEDARPLARAAHQSSDDESFAAVLNEWASMNSFDARELSPTELAEHKAETETEAAKYMRRLGFRPFD